MSLDTVIHSDGWRGYDGLVDLGYARHLRVNHDKDQFADADAPGNHINGIESFWRASGATPRRCWPGAGACIRTRSRSTSKSASSASTTGAKTCTMSSSTCAVATRSASHDTSQIATDLHRFREEGLGAKS